MYTIIVFLALFALIMYIKNKKPYRTMLYSSRFGINYEPLTGTLSAGERFTIEAGGKYTYHTGLRFKTNYKQIVAISSLDSRLTVANSIIVSPIEIVLLLENWSGEPITISEHQKLCTLHVLELPVYRFCNFIFA